MSDTYHLFRGGLQIPILKEPEFFTAILPTPGMAEQIQHIPGVELVKAVHGQVYKIRTQEQFLDGLMDELRHDYRTQAIFHHAYHPYKDPTTRYYLTDKIIVRFKFGTSVERIEKLMKEYGLQFLRQYETTPHSLLVRVSSSAGKNPVKVSQALQMLPEIEYAEPNLLNRFAPAYSPGDGLFPKQWHLKSREDIELSKDAHIHVEQAWKHTRGSRDIVVAVIDDGFDLDHPDLKGDGKKIVFPRDFVDGDLSPYPVAELNDYHGTPCAGLAIGEAENEGIVGVAPGCSFLPIRFSLRADDDELYDIFEHASKHAHVISCSWGPVPVFAPLSSLTHSHWSRITKSGGPDGKGANICFAAGNFNAPLNDPENENFEWRHPRLGLLPTRGKILNGNAAHPDVIAVAASTSMNKKAAYSNWGREIAVCAPSSNWHPIDPQARVAGRSLWTADNESRGAGFNSRSRYTDRFGGTSGSAPMVAGALALIRSAHPGLLAEDAKKILLETSDKIRDLDPDLVLGHIKGVYTRDHSEWFGYGKINVGKAVTEALKNAPPTEKEEDPIENEEQEVEEILVELPIDGDMPSKEIMESALRIVAALPNPKGRHEKGREFVGLLNTSTEKIDLTAYTLRVNKRSMKLEALVIEGHGYLNLYTDIPLSNKGATISFLNPEDQTVAQVSYTAKQAREGVLVVF